MTEQGLEICRRDFPSTLDSGRLVFMQHDFFESNPIKGADIYWMRNVLFVPHQSFLPLPLPLSLSLSCTSPSRPKVARIRAHLCNPPLC